MTLQKIQQFVTRPDLGLLFIRVFGGGLLFAHGIKIFMGGSSAMEGTGGAIAVYGINFGFLFWGILVAAIESVAGLFIVLGLFTRIAALVASLVLLTAVILKWPGSLAPGAIDQNFGYPLLMLGTLLCIMFEGAGKHAVKKD
ncbi:MAG: DoxX family protein [Opitutales bacterium]|nr:DoxX family protein [Opitutales bacterium]